VLQSAEHSPRIGNLQRLLQPRHIAFIGGEKAALAMAQCLAAGFAGEVWPVNPGRAQMAGCPCYPTVAELPAPPDAAFIAVPKEATVAVVEDLAAIGAGGCVCYAAGFAELGAEGAALQDRLVAAAGQMALIGPNCYGLLNYLDGVALWPDLHGGCWVEQGVAIVSQSGNIALNLTMNQRSVPLAYVISVGNQAVTGIGDCIEALIADPRVAAIGLYIEGWSDLAGFSRAAAAALSKGVPLVALTAGSSEVGRRLALSHTASLAGETTLAQAVFRRLGIFQVNSLPSFMEALKFLALNGPLDGNRLMLMTCSGGEAALVADLAEPRGLELAELNEPQTRALRRQLPDFATVSNPLDYNTGIWGDPVALEACFATMMAGESDATLLVLDTPKADLAGCEDWDQPITAMIGARARHGRPAAVACSLPELLHEPARARMAAHGVVPLHGLDEAVTALAGAVWYGRRCLELKGRALALPGPAALPGEARVLDEWDSKQALKAAGVLVPMGRQTTAREAPDVAAELGFPVALKALGVAHKTEAGAVALGLEDQAAVAAAADRLAAQSERLLVESMVSGVVAELLVGVEHDPQFGLALVIGAGGELVELIDDTATLLLPTDRAAVAEAVESLKVCRLLAGYRGRPKGDMAAVIQAVLAIAGFAQEHRHELLELDVNPLLVLPEGVVAADALLCLAER
jgi:acetyl-CoA synthetase